VCSKHFLPINLFSINSIFFYPTLVETTRVKLSGDGDNDYINANHVKVSCVCISMLKLLT